MPESHTKAAVMLGPKINFLNSVFLFAGVVAFGMGFVRWQASAVMGAIDFAFSLCNFALVYYLHSHKERIEAISTTALVLSYGLFTAIYLLAPYNTTRISLFFLLLASAFFLKGRRVGRVWLLIILVTLIAGHFLPAIDTAYSHVDILTTSLYLLALFFIFINYETFKEKLNERDLEKEVLRLSEERFRTLIENGNDIIIIVSEAGVLKFLSPSVESVLGYAPDEMIDRDIHEFIHIDEQRKVASALAYALAHPDGESLERFEFRMKHRDGSYRDIEMAGRNLIANPVILGIVLNGRDITERKRADEELRIAATAFETEEGIMITDQNTHILRVNHAFTHLTGYSAEDAIGKTPALLHSGRHDEEFYRSMWEALLRDNYWRGEVWNRKKNGEIYPQALAITGVPDPDGVVTHYVAVSSDITQRKLAEEQISFLAYHDKLTKLPNRTLFYDRMSQRMSQSRRKDSHFALLFLDLDGFKAVNDAYGHEAGDTVLSTSADRLLSCVRDADTVARLGGDEFAIILGDIVQQADVIAVAEKIIQKLMEPVPLHDERVCSVGVSIGIAIYPEHGLEIDRLLRAADAAMYESKAAGKGTHTFAKKQ